MEEEEDQVNTADYDEEDEDLTSMEERLQPQLQPTILGPRPLSKPLAGATATLPQAVLKASSCEYLLDQRSTTQVLTTTATEASAMADTSPTRKMMYLTQTASPISTSSTITTVADTSVTTMTKIATMTMTMPPTTMVTTTASPTTVMTSYSSMASTIPITPNPVVSLASITTSSVSATIRREKDASSSRELVASATFTVMEKSEVKTLPRPAKFIPPPPPPRRLLLTQTNLKTSGTATKSPPKAVSEGNYFHLLLDLKS